MIHVYVLGPEVGWNAIPHVLPTVIFAGHLLFIIATDDIPALQS